MLSFLISIVFVHLRFNFDFIEILLIFWISLLTSRLVIILSIHPLLIIYIFLWQCINETPYTVYSIPSDYVCNLTKQWWRIFTLRNIEVKFYRGRQFHSILNQPFFVGHKHNVVEILIAKATRNILHKLAIFTYEILTSMAWHWSNYRVWCTLFISGIDETDLIFLVKIHFDLYNFTAVMIIVKLDRFQSFITTLLYLRIARPVNFCANNFARVIRWPSSRHLGQLAALYSTIVHVNIIYDLSRSAW
jgi:hypothetical protein